MKILFIGDIVGEPGRQVIKHWVPILRQEMNLDFVVANGENANSSGGGLKPSNVKEIFGCGVDAITLGDHAWDQRDIMSVIDQEEYLMRPLNYPPGVSGHGSALVKKNGKCLGVLNLQGRVFMNQPLENPFHAGKARLEEMRKQTPCILVDFHAETTSEKIALGKYFDGLASAVVGTHTHVTTADEHVQPKGTAFICDVGMTGPHDSVLGRDSDQVIKRFLTNLPQRFPVVEGDLRLNAVLIEMDDFSGKASKIERVSRRMSTSNEIGDAFGKAFGGG